MSEEIYLLLITAVSIGFIHTILGPDHYIPFIVMSKAGKWSKFKTIWITVLSGTGHVLSSVLLGAIGIGFGVALHELEAIESSRGEIAAWLMITFGLIYFIWGLKRAYKNKKHTHFHSDENGVYHNLEHDHMGENTHVHKEEKSITKITPWIIFTIFVFGPCEALIPILMFPAANESTMGLLLVILTFGLSTILTMLAAVFIGITGFKIIPFKRYERYAHAMAGLLILLSGGAIRLLGL